MGIRVRFGELAGQKKRLSLTVTKLSWGRIAERYYPHAGSGYDTWSGWQPEGFDEAFRNIRSLLSAQGKVEERLSLDREPVLIPL